MKVHPISLGIGFFLGWAAFVGISLAILSRGKHIDFEHGDDDL